MIHQREYDDLTLTCGAKTYYFVTYCGFISNCLISDNNMTGIVILKSTHGLFFIGRNVIQNNRNTQGAGIVLMNNIHIVVSGELLLYNNTADKHGGAILVMQPLFNSQLTNSHCTMNFYEASSVIFSGNRAGLGGSDMYGAILMDCDSHYMYYASIDTGHISHV